MKSVKPRCERCGTDDPLLCDFMLADALWQKLDFQRFGCLRCVQQQLGRQLVKADFFGYLYNAINVSVLTRAAIEDTTTPEADVLRAELLEAALMLIKKRDCPVCEQHKYGVRARRRNTNNGEELENWITSCEQCFGKFH